MGRKKPFINKYLIQILICFTAVFSFAVILIPQPSFAMGSSYEDCTGHNMKELNTLATEGLYLAEKIQGEARKNPLRLQKTITVLETIEMDLNRVRNMTASRTKTTNIVVRSEIDRFVKEGAIQRQEFHDVMGLLYAVFRESIAEQNADKRYWINKLDEMNRIGDALSNYLRQLNDVAVEMKEQCDEPKQPYTPQYKLEEQQLVPDKPATTTQPAISR